MAAGNMQILLCARAKQVFMNNCKNGASQEGAWICFPASGCCQHPTAKSGCIIWCLVYPKESINIDSKEESTGFGWKLQQLVCAGICEIPHMEETCLETFSSWVLEALKCYE